MSRRMMKQYNIGQIRRIQADLSALFPPEKVGTPDQLKVIYQELKRRKSPLAEAMLILTQVQTALRKRGNGRTLYDVDKVIVWEGDPPEIQIEFKQAIGRRKYPAISSVGA